MSLARAENDGNFPAMPSLQQELRFASQSWRLVLPSQPTKWKPHQVSEPNSHAGGTMGDAREAGKLSPGFSLGLRGS